MMTQISSDASVDFDVRSAQMFADRLAESGVAPALDIQAPNDVSLVATATEYAAVAAWLNAIGYPCTYFGPNEDEFGEDRMSVNMRLADLYAGVCDAAAQVIEDETRDTRGSFSFWQGRDGWYFTALQADGMTADHYFQDQGPFADRAAVIDAIDDQVAEDDDAE